MRPGFRSLVRNLLHAGVVLLACLMIIEVGLRLANRPAGGLHTVSEGDYERIPGMFEPGQDFINLEKAHLPHRIQINSLGFRGAEISLQRTRPRILFLGDSFTFGVFVDEQDTLPAQVQARLGQSAEVVNGGMGGTTLTDQRVFLKRYLAIQPDIVVLVFHDNDLSDILAVPPRHVSLARNRLRKSGMFRFAYRLVRDTATFDVALHVQNRFRRVPEWKEEERSAGKLPEWLDEALSLYVSEAVALERMLQSREINLLVTAYPGLDTLDPSREKAQFEAIGLVSGALSVVGISVVDLTPALRASGYRMDELHLIPGDAHPSPHGYAIAADVLVPHLREILEKREYREDSSTMAKHADAPQGGWSSSSAPQ